jgi:hypothetical protein
MVFSPWNMVIIRRGGDVGSPPCSSHASELLRSVQSLLILCTVKEPKLGLRGAESAVRLQGVGLIGKDWRVSCQKIRV